jgi:hypothetical protein
MDEYWLGGLIVGLVVLMYLGWWCAGFTSRNIESHNLYRQYIEDEKKTNAETVDIHSKMMALSEESNRLQAQEIAVMREIVGILRERQSKPGNADSQSR